jgi:hypothetical protein
MVNIVIELKLTIFFQNNYLMVLDIVIELNPYIFHHIANTPGNIPWTTNLVLYRDTYGKTKETTVPVWDQISRHTPKKENFHLFNNWPENEYLFMATKNGNDKSTLRNSVGDVSKRISATSGVWLFHGRCSLDVVRLHN